MLILPAGTEIAVRAGETIDSSKTEEGRTYAADVARGVADASGDVVIPKGTRQRRLHKAFLRYHDPDNWPLLREALRQMGRSDLIGNGRNQLVPTYQPIGTGRAHEGQRKPGKTAASPTRTSSSSAAPASR